MSDAGGEGVAGGTRGGEDTGATGAGDGAAASGRGPAARAARAVEVLGRRPPDHRLKERFLRWQCRVRQLAMREAGGRPNDAMMPALTLPGDDAPLGHLIVLISKWGAYSRTGELRHLYKRTNDPAQRREKALELFCETWYQQAREFSDTLTATFPAGSPGASRILEHGRARLEFDAFSQRFTLECAVRELRAAHPLREATWWHNVLFNPALPPDTRVLAFEPDWERSVAEGG